MNQDYALTVTVEPEECLSLEAVKNHLRVDDTADDALITGLIAAARQYVEEICNLALMPQTLVMQKDEWPSGTILYMPRVPLAEVTEIAYIDADGVSHTMDLEDVIVDTISKPGRLILQDDADWPTSTLRSAAGIAITYEAGFADPDRIPKPLMQALLLLIGHLYENREAVVIGSGINLFELPLAFKHLIANYRYGGVIA